MAVAAAVVIAGGGAGVGGALGGAGVEAGTEALAGNTAGDVVDSLPGRSLKTRKAEAQKSAKNGKTDEALGRFKLKRLKKQAEHEFECLAASDGKVRDFLARTPCTSLDRLLMAVGDGHGNAAVVSVVRVGFRDKKQATAFEKVERVQGSGDVRPLEIAAVLGLTGVRISGRHYRSRADKNGMVVAETETATGHLDAGTLDALADVAAYFPIR
ncbi:hypothetical protein OG943_33165 [Amycolatopsis sp. NBC_00345]|uniref:hypothetical protein n=1 Tax=Amycolatopsis sp. NBC_00345 TaxID=2975955 RepID=UPI002E2662C1